MPQYRLVKISLSGRCSIISNSQSIDDLTAVCIEVMKKNPGYDYGIVDEDGYFLWPDKYKKPAQRDGPSVLNSLLNT